MREPSPSKLGLLDHCTHPFTSGTRWPWEEDSKHAALGHAVHSAIHAIAGGDPVAFEEAARHFDKLTDRERERASRMTSRALEMLERDVAAGREILGFEVDLRYDVENGRARRGSGRKEVKRPGEWSAVIDLVLREGSTLIVRDWKTGRQQHTEDVHANPQIRVYARAAASVFGAPAVRVELVYLDEHSEEIERAPFDRLDLTAIVGEMRARRARVRVGPTPPKPGPHCTEKFCPLLGVCAATRAALASAYPLEHPLTTEIKDADHARFILERLPGAQKALDAVDAAVKTFAKTTPIPRDDGKIYAWREKRERDVKVTNQDHVEALRAVLGEHVAKAVETKLVASLGSIEDAARAVLAERKQTRGISALVDKAFGELVRAGGARIATYQKPEWFKPKEAN